MSRTLLVRLSFGILALAGAWIAYTQNPQAPAQLTLEKIKDDLWVIIGDGGNVAVYPTNEGTILIDDKFERDYSDIMGKVKSVTAQPVKYVLNTHQHGDHTGGNEKMRGASAEIISHSNARANMVEQKMPGLAHVTFTNETEVFLGGKEVRARYFGRGHTNGDVAIYFPALKVLHTGDLFTVGMSSAPVTIAPFIDYSGKGSAMEWTKTLDGILNSGWDFDVVIPGHGPISKREDLVKYRQNFETMRNKVTSMLHDGKGKDDLTKTLKSDFGWADGGNGMRQLDAMIAELKR
jgi:glyoxylase-like metal-dependent hydrolase (beta-lactamase superfamily II)